MKKPRFIYLIQGDLSYPVYNIPQGSDFLYLQWKKDFSPRENHLHFPGSSWAQGRNHLYQLVKDKGYDYYVFMDDDLFFGDPREGWKYLRPLLGNLKRGQWGKAFWSLRNYKKRWDLNDFEKAMSEALPMIGSCHYYAHLWNRDLTFHPTDNVAYNDQNLIAIHQSVAPQVLPYETRYDSLSWWACGELLFDRARFICAQDICRFNFLPLATLRKSNESSDYPRDVTKARLPLNQVFRYSKEVPRG